MRAISFPFSQDIQGKTTTTTSTTKLYLDRLLTLLSTAKGQRPVLTEYGTDIAAALFENDNDYPTAIRAAVTTAVARWMPDVSIVGIDLNNAGDGTVNVSITIELPNAQVTTLTVNSASFNADGTINSAGI